MVATAQHIGAQQRHSKARPCPICGGGDRDPRGKGRRCHGFTSEDFAHCSREEHAGGLVATEGNTYGHRLYGPCACGLTHGDDQRGAAAFGEVSYEYRDERRQLLFKVVRLAGKNFRQCRPDGLGWTWSTAGVRRVLYRLPELLDAPRDATVYVVEGEKDVDNLRRIGAVATTNPMGAGKWSFVAEHARTVLRDRHVVIIADADEPGRKHAADVLASLTDIAVTATVLELPTKDASDWIDAGGTFTELRAMTARPANDETPATPNRSKLITVGDALQQLVKIGNAPVYTSPFPTLNEAIGLDGFLGGQSYNLAAGTGRGKTSWVGQQAMHTAATGHDVLIAIYEAFPGYNVARMAAGPLGVHSNQIIRDVGKHGPAVTKAIPPRIFFLDRPSLSLIREAADQLANASGKPPMVIVDYLQKLADGIQAEQNRPDARLATSQASAGLMDLASSTGSPVIAVSATSRMNNRKTADPRKLSPYELVDVAKESGAVEYDSAGLIVLSLSDDHEGDERIATMTVAKARFGEEVHIDMRFDGKRGAWRDLGRVERGSGSVEMPLRDAIRLALKTTSAPNTAEIIRRTKRGRNDVLAELRAMVIDGEVDKSDGYSLIGDGE